MIRCDRDVRHWECHLHQQNINNSIKTGDGRLEWRTLAVTILHLHLSLLRIRVNISILYGHYLVLMDVKLD